MLELQVSQMKKIEEEKLKLQLENQEMQKVNEELTSLLEEATTFKKDNCSDKSIQKPVLVSSDKHVIVSDSLSYNSINTTNATTAPSNLQTITNSVNPQYSNGRCRLLAIKKSDDS
jgi:hypothetical protein